MSTPSRSDLVEIACVQRNTRGPYRKSNATNATTQKGAVESIDAEGRLPGSKDGLGAFPPGSGQRSTTTTAPFRKRWRSICRCCCFGWWHATRAIRCLLEQRMDTT
ncbi:hypothetical protein C8J55DRAFT_155801 [Lentinula edodes]|uniref:Uncharacterized protein n=1 Tax=Lentinula lateritia TaxID=40482 RepID=A0A9W9DHS5_9AGAR|nr:hypothetical protein C8J55DRAFT_155801 [Lentinula edodes]